MKSPVCHDPVSQASWAFAETADIAGGGTGEGPKDSLGKLALPCAYTQSHLDLCLRLQFVATERTPSASAKRRKDGKMTE